MVNKDKEEGGSGTGKTEGTEGNIRAINLTHRYVSIPIH